MTGVTVVTGAAGHVGSNLCAALCADGHRVRAVDLREPVEAIHHGAQWVRADIRDALVHYAGTQLLRSDNI